MGKPYSTDLRERAVSSVLEGKSRNKAAAQFAVAVSAVVTWVKRYQETGSVEPGQMGGHKPKSIRGEHEAFLTQRVRERAFTLRGLVRELAERGLKVDYRSVWNFVQAEKLSFKKTVVASERERPDVARRRAQWTERQDRIDPERLVFIDETWIKTNMEPLRGWAPRGERLIAKVPHGHWKTSTFIAALRCDRIEAPWLLDGPINAAAFTTYVEKVLTPTLRPGDLVIMDNLGSHKGKAVRHPRRRRKAHLPAQRLPGLEPDRAGLRQAQASPAKGRRPNDRDPHCRRRRAPRRLHRRGMRQLLRQLRVRANLKSSRSSSLGPRIGTFQ